MGRSFQIGKVAGIPVKVHWSFGFMLFFILFLGQANGLNAERMIWFSLFILVLFFCVILHEFGHALAARKYGVETYDIIISPIGGLARLKSLPENPIYEFYIAIAGPLVNVFLGVVVGAIVHFGYGQNLFDVQENFVRIHVFSEFLKHVFLINVALFVFNLLPAFPMDGGRVLRSLLSMKLPRLKATFIASVIGKIMAVGFVIVAVFNFHLILGFVGIFIFTMAHAEYKQVKVETNLKNTSLGDVMVVDYVPMRSDTLIKDINQDTGLKNHLVVNESNDLIGSLPRQFIEETQDALSINITAGELASSKVRFMDVEESIYSAKQTMQEEGLGIVAVTKNGQLQGVVDRDLIIDLINSY